MQNAYSPEDSNTLLEIQEQEAPRVIKQMKQEWKDTHVRHSYGHSVLWNLIYHISKNGSFLKKMYENHTKFNRQTDITVT
jgi:hypothetical protein